MRVIFCGGIDRFGGSRNGLMSPLYLGNRTRRRISSIPDSTLQDEVHHVVVFRLILGLQTLGKMGQTDFDSLHDRILL